MILALALLAMHAGALTPVAPPPKAVTIDAAYPASSRFRIRFEERDVTAVHGSVPPSFKSASATYKGSIALWYGGMDGRYRISKSAGEVVAISAGKRSHQHVTGKIEFDLLGYPRHGPSDIAELIPIFAGHPVPQGGSWTAHAPITSPFGTATMTYRYTLTRISRDARGDAIAAVRFAAAGGLRPTPPLRGYAASVSLRGTFDWDCTAHQRTRKNYRIVYEASRAGSSIREVITHHDTVLGTRR